VIRVFIVAASPLARAGLENLLAARGVSVVGRSASLESLFEQIVDVEPDVVLVDASGDNSEAALDALVASDLAIETIVILLCDHSRSGWIAEALRAGVRAILPSEVSPDQLAAALQAAMAGLVVVHPSEIAVALPAASAALSPLAELTEPLTPREREVLQMLASGLVNKEIAAKLSISEHTVKFHVASILGKLGAATRTEAVSLGFRRGLILL
jgi:two-component system, NarL family, response regulator YdfI